MPTMYTYQPSVESQAQDGNGKVIKGAVCTFWTRRDGDPDKAQVTGISELDGSPIADDTLVCDQNGFLPRAFLAPTPSLWIDGGDGALVLMQATDLPTRVAGVEAAQAGIQSQLDGKADQVTVDAALGLKADLDYVDAADAAKVDRGSTVVLATDHGVKADGATDDTAALNAALTAAQGKLLLMPGGTANITDVVTFPDDVVVRWNGMTISCPAIANVFPIHLYGNRVVFLDELHLDVGFGADCRGVEVKGSDCDLAAVKVTCATPGNGSGNHLDQGFRMSGSSNSRIGRLTVSNWDYATWFSTCTDLTVESVTITGFKCGLHITDCQRMHVNGGSATGASPNAIVDAGNNGVLIDANTDFATSDLWIDRFLVSDSGEHGYRIGSQVSIRDVYHSACVARNTGASGFKVLGATPARHENIYYTDCIAEDCGQTESNHSGFLVQGVYNAVVTNPTVRKRNKAFSAYNGVRVSWAEKVTIVNINVSDTVSHGYLLDQMLGDNTNVAVRGGQIIHAGGDSIHMDFTGVQFRRIGVYGHVLCESAGGYGVQIINSGGGATTRAVIEAEIWFPALGVAAGNLGYYIANIIGEFADVNFANGSLWQDYTNQVVKAKAAGTWTQV